MQDDIYAHDWSGHMDSIRELAEVFPTLCCDFADTIDKLEKDREAIGQQPTDRKSLPLNNLGAGRPAALDVSPYPTTTYDSSNYLSKFQKKVIIHLD